MPGYRHWATIGATLCSALCASLAGLSCWEMSPVLALFFASLVAVSVLFCFGCRWTLSLVVGGNLAFWGREATANNGPQSVSLGGVEKKVLWLLKWILTDVH